VGYNRVLHDCGVSWEQKSHRLKGYGFVSYYNDEAGYNAAQRALNELHDTTLDEVTYKCELSNILEAPPPQQQPMHAHYAQHSNMLGSMGVLNAFGELEYPDVGQHQSSYYDDYSAHTGLSLNLPGHGGTYANGAPSAGGDSGSYTQYGSTPRSSLESNYDPVSPSATVPTSSPGAIGRRPSGNGSSLLNSALDREYPTEQLSVQNSVGKNGSLELQAPSQLDEELRGLYAYPTANGGGSTPTTLGQRTPSTVESSVGIAGADCATPGSAGLPPHPGNGGFNHAPRPHNPAPRPYAPHAQPHQQPPFRYNGAGNGHNQGYRDHGYGPQYQTHQHGAPEHGLSAGQYDPQYGQQAPAHLRRSHSGGSYHSGDYAPPSHPAQQLQQWQLSQQRQQPFNGYPAPVHAQSSPRGQVDGFNGPGGFYNGQNRYQGQGQGQGAFHPPNAPLPYQSRPPIYARAQQPTPQQQQLQLQLLSQQFAQRDLHVGGYDVTAASPRQPSLQPPPSPSLASRGPFSDLSLDILSVSANEFSAPLGAASLHGNGFQMHPTSPQAPIGSLYLSPTSTAASTAGEPFPLRQLSRSASSTSSSSSAYGSSHPSKSSLLAVGALGASSSDGIQLGACQGLNNTDTVETLLEGDPSMWLPANFDLPQM
jgi:hypothetical protein